MGPMAQNQWILQEFKIEATEATEVSGNTS